MKLINPRCNLRAAASLGAVGFCLAGLMVLRFAADSYAWTLAVGAGTASFAVAFVLWRVLCSGSSISLVRRGTLVGALTGLLAHPIAWYVAVVLNYLMVHPLFAGKRPVGLIAGIGTSMAYSVFSISLSGWLTCPVAATAGWILARRQLTRQTKDGIPAQG